MAQITTENKKQLKKYILELTQVNSQLCYLYSKLIKQLLVAYVNIIIWGFAIGYMYYFATTSNKTILFIFSCLNFIVLSLHYHRVIKKTISLYKDVYQKGLIGLNDLMKYVDWQIYRKRQLYEETDSNVENVVNGFLYHAGKTFAPTNSNNHFFDAFVILQIILRYLVYIASIIAFLNIY
jgi:uncharacterized protein (UPF0333 family)